MSLSIGHCDLGWRSHLKGNGIINYFLNGELTSGGWNNIRMAMETVIVMAHAMGRTLVLPPEKRMYLIGKVSQDICADIYLVRHYLLALLC